MDKESQKIIVNMIYIQDKQNRKCIIHGIWLQLRAGDADAFGVEWWALVTAALARPGHPTTPTTSTGYPAKITPENATDPTISQTRESRFSTPRPPHRRRTRPPPPAMAMATALRKLSANALRRQPLSRITPLYYMVRRRPLHLLFVWQGGGLFLSSAYPLSKERKIHAAVPIRFSDLVLSLLRA